MKKQRTAVVLLAGVSSLLVACKAHEETSPAAQEKAPPPAAMAAEATLPLPATPAPAPVVVPATPAASTAPAPPPRASERPAVSAPPKPAQDGPEAQPTGQPPKPAGATATPASLPAGTAPTSPPAAAPTTAQAPGTPSAPDVVDPGGEVAVPPAKAGVTRAGPEKCKLCHKVQHSSWAASAHARRTPPLDCESCHGPGSEYKALAVMKDPAKARAAGLVQPDAAFCGRCHKRPWDPALLGKVHAHKAAS